jgi:hypothetical protein
MKAVTESENVEVDVLGGLSENYYMLSVDS